MAKRESTTGDGPMQTAHFVWLAKWCVEYRKFTSDSAADDVVVHLTNHLGMQHPRFDRAKFMKAARGGE